MPRLLIVSPAVRPVIALRARAVFVPVHLAIAVAIQTTEQRGVRLPFVSRKLAIPIPVPGIEPPAPLPFSAAIIVFVRRDPAVPILVQSVELSKSARPLIRIQPSITVLVQLPNCHRGEIG